VALSDIPHIRYSLSSLPLNSWYIAVWPYPTFLIFVTPSHPFRSIHYCSVALSNIPHIPFPSMHGNRSVALSNIPPSHIMVFANSSNLHPSHPSCSLPRCSSWRCILHLLLIIDVDAWCQLSSSINQISLGQRSQGFLLFIIYYSRTVPSSWQLQLRVVGGEEGGSTMSSSASDDVANVFKNVSGTVHEYKFIITQTPSLMVC
jgi:hypothetical protein